MFSVSHLYFISHRWVHFFCTHLSVTFLYMCLLKSLFFYCHGDWLSISLCSRLLWSIPDNVICWVPDIDLRLSRRFTLVCSWFISFFFISSDKYICWQEVTIKPSWNFTSLNSFSLMFVIMNFHRYMRKSTPPRKIQRFEFTL